MRKIPIVIIFLFLFCFGFALQIQAQDVSLGIATAVEMSEKGAQDGDIISSKAGGGFVRSKISYDPFLFGVISLNPAIYLHDKTFKNGTPVVSSGKAYVRVSTEKGAISKGDRITSSTSPGIGIKATENGYIVGTAEEDYKATNPKQIGKILVAVDPRFAQINSNLAATLFTLPRFSFTEILQSPSAALRYLLAGLIVVGTFLLGFRFFANVSTRGVEALGRNPLAKRSILLGIGINSILIIGVMIFGIAAAYLILAF